ncbi:MAG: methylated-DNA--[protein]-cysteine S-methyltransferase [Limisphaerales bacterium]
MYYDIFLTPLGKFAAAVDETGALVGAGFGGKEALPRWAAELTHHPRAVAAGRGQIEEYLAGKRREFTLHLAPRGTAFQQWVWTALQRIAFGETRSYGELAAEAGKPGGARAIGQAVGSNPICLVIPCHRVIAADGSLGGFAYGVEMKRRLLELEKT